MVVTIANPNSYPVTIDAVNLPTNATYAAGYTTNTLSTASNGVLGHETEPCRLELLHGARVGARTP